MCVAMTLLHGSHLCSLVYEFTAQYPHRTNMGLSLFLLWYPPVLCLLGCWNALETSCHAKSSWINMNHFLLTGFLVLCC